MVLPYTTLQVLKPLTKKVEKKNGHTTKMDLYITLTNLFTTTMDEGQNIYIIIAPTK